MALVTNLIRSLNMVGVAQLVRVSDCGSEGRRFESGLPPQKIKQPIGLLIFLGSMSIVGVELK